MTPTELRLQSRNDQLEVIRQKHEALLLERGDGNLSDADKELIESYRRDTASLEEELAGLVADKEAHDRSVERSAAIRRLTIGGNGFTGDEDGVAYRDFKSYAHDFLVTRNFPECAKIARQWELGDAEIASARQRLDLLARTPDNTLSSNVGGLIPPQHIADVFQVINKSRALVNAARRVDLVRGSLTYPQVDTTPVVAAQASEKTEGGTTRLAVSMVTKTPTVYIGGGDLSWQAINWSTPSAIDLWFDYVSADYALKTETDAATVVSASAFLNNVSSPISGSATFADFMTGVGAGYAEVWANSGRIANTIIMAPDRFGYLLGMTSAAFTQFVTVGQDGVGPLNVIVSRGLNSGEIIVGDMAGLLVAETPGAPVEMRVVEPAIGGVEVGLIGAFEAAVVDDGAFALITTAS